MGPEISIRPEQIFSIGLWPVTNSLALAVLALLVLVGTGFLLRRKLSLIPGRFQNICEILLEALLGLMDSVLGERRLSEKYLPIVATIFLFILTSNWLGLFPLVGPIKIATPSYVPLFRSPASDLNFTLALATIAMLGVQLAGMIGLGVKKHLGKFFTLKNPIFTFVGLLEFISEFIKIISVAFRLFGNVFAGEVLLAIVGFLLPYIVPLPFMFLEVFVGFIQAFIFSILTLVFISMATAVEAHEVE